MKKPKKQKNGKNAREMKQEAGEVEIYVESFLVNNYKTEICGAKLDDKGIKFCPQNADKCNDHLKSRGSCFSDKDSMPFLAIYCDQSKASA